MHNLKDQLKGYKFPQQPRRPRIHVWTFWAAACEFAKLHYAHNRVAKPIRY